MTASIHTIFHAILVTQTIFHRCLRTKHPRIGLIENSCLFSLLEFGSCGSGVKSLGIWRWNKHGIRRPIVPQRELTLFKIL